MPSSPSLDAAAAAVAGPLMMMHQYHQKNDNNHDDNIIANDTDTDTNDHLLLCHDEDALLHILSYLDVTSAVRLLKCTSRTWRQRGDQLQQILTRNAACNTHHYNYNTSMWRLWYDRLGYSPAKLYNNTTANNNTNDYVLMALAESRRLQKNLLGGTAGAKSTMRRTNNCFSLPNQWFSFLPIAPDDDSIMMDNEDDENDNDDFFATTTMDHHHHHDDHDPPPVSFDCDSFLLTGQGTELVLLNPFTMTVTVYKSVLDHVIYSDEGMMEKAWRAASHRIVQQQERRDRGGVNSTATTTAVATAGIVGEESMSEDSDSSSSSSIAANDNGGDDIDDVNDDEEEEYLLAADAIQETLHRNHYVRQSPYRVDPQQTLVGLQDTVYVRLEDYFAPRGTTAADRDNEEYELSYAGIDAKPVWNAKGQLQATLLALGRIVVRFPDHNNNDNVLIQNPDFVPDEEGCWEILTWRKGHDEETYTKGLACRFRGSFHNLDVCPYQNVVYMNPCREAHEDFMEDNDNIFSMWAGQRVIRAIPLSEVPDAAVNPVAEWECRNPVTAMVVSPSYPGNTVLVATNARALEIYNRTKTGAELVQLISIPTAVSAAYQRYQRKITSHPAPVTEILCAKDLPLSKAGFWTLQHSAVHGSTLSLWKLMQQHEQPPKTTMENEKCWDVATVLKLPLSSHRTPKVFYDGRRLLIYGQDHIGMILLVYHVSYSNEDDFSGIPVGTEASGGVLNVNSHVASTRFANRIRHVALSGMENALYESLYMTANERFVILNTKSGNLLSGSSTPYREGLLVIDLQDEETSF